LHELKDLQLFKCHSCNIAFLPQELFKGLDKLRRISLHNNKIAQLPSSIFNGLTSLEELRLTRNRLSSLPVGFFDTAASLVSVDLGYNELESLPNDLFAKNLKMKQFQMIGNGACQPYRGCVPEKEKRLKLSPTTFHSNSIAEIRINHSPIKEIPETLFKGCRKLVNSTIQHSLIDQLPENLFKDTEAIQLIDFSGTKLSSLEAGLFQSVKSVKSLRFISNNLTNLDEDLLFTLKKLEIFHFQENQLSGFPRELFRKNGRLSDIDLSHNNIHEWPGNPHTFESMITLNLAHNKLTSIPLDFHLNFLSLKVLNMSHNLLGSKDPKILPNDLNFLQNTNLKVDLSFNQIGSVELWDDGFWAEDNSWPGFSLDLRGNPLKCNCRTKELKQMVVILM
jgi:protein toll